MSRMILVLALLAFGAFVTPALAASFNVTVQTDHASYVGIAPIAINGTVSPSPGPDTAVIIDISNPDHQPVDVESDPVNATTGSFSQLTVSGGGTCSGGVMSNCWISGTYLVNATWGGPGGTAIGTTTFAYSSGKATTTTLSCNPTTFVAGASTQCTATVSGATGDISGEPIYWNYDNRVFPGQGCTLFGTSCSMTFTGIRPGSANLLARYPGDALNSPSNASENVTVLAATTTSVVCTPSDVDIIGPSTCTATVTGAVGAIMGETITFSQASGETGSVNMTSPATCNLGSGGSCSISVTGATPGAVTIEATYPGDAANGASSGTASLTALFIHSTVTSTSASSSSSTSFSTVGSSAASASTTYLCCTTSTLSSGGLGWAAYLILAAVAAIVFVFGVVIWRRPAGRSTK